MAFALYSESRLAQLLLWSVCWSASIVAAGMPANEGWTYIRHADDVALYRQPVKGSTQPALLGQVRFHASLSEVHRVISDYDHFAEFIPLVSDSRVLDRSAQTTWVYQRLDLPLLVADRHYIIEIEDDLQALAAGIIDVRWQLDKPRSYSLAPDQAVLPTAMSGYWHLAALPNQEGCDAVYSVHAEPGGGMPGWLFTRVSERYVVQVINAVRMRIAEHDR